MTTVILFFSAAVIGVVIFPRAREAKARLVPIAVRRRRETDERARRG
jgi:hypothetical protein